MKQLTRACVVLVMTSLIATACAGGDGGGETNDDTGSVETPSPSPTPTALLSEDFESEETAFELTTNGNAEVSVEDGQLVLYSEDDEAESIAPLAQPVEGLTFDIDFEMGQARESLDAGTEDWFGVACTQGEDAYFMMADVYGSFFLFSRKDGQYKQIGDNYKKNFQPEIGDTHHLEAACTQDAASGAVGMSLFIDGQEMLTGADTKNPIGPFDGVAVFGQQDESEGDTAYSTFLFDNAEVQPLES
jgi:hypothetical protein